MRISVHPRFVGARSSLTKSLAVTPLEQPHQLMTGARQGNFGPIDSTRSAGDQLTFQSCDRNYPQLGDDATRSGSQQRGYMQS